MDLDLGPLLSYSLSMYWKLLNDFEKLIARAELTGWRQAGGAEENEKLSQPRDMHHD